MTQSDLEALMAFQLRAHGYTLIDYIEEWQFCQRRWRFDFAWPLKKVALEVEGGTHSGGRHTRGSGFEKDCEKYNEATLQGWRVIRVTGAMVKDGRALQVIERALEER